VEKRQQGVARDKENGRRTDTKQHDILAVLHLTQANRPVDLWGTHLGCCATAEAENPGRVIRI